MERFTPLLYAIVNNIYMENFPSFSEGIIYQSYQGTRYEI